MPLHHSNKQVPPKLSEHNPFLCASYSNPSKGHQIYTSKQPRTYSLQALSCHPPRATSTHYIPSPTFLAFSSNTPPTTPPHPTPHPPRSTTPSITKRTSPNSTTPCPKPLPCKANPFWTSKRLWEHRMYPKEWLGLYETMGGARGTMLFSGR